jgi:penicillin-binding protein 1A
MLSTIGIPRAVSFAQKLNFGTPASVPSLALGASEVTLLSLTAAYGAFADEGIVRQPFLIRRVTDAEGKLLYQGLPKSHPAVSRETAFLMSSMLADVINAGTAVRARQIGFTLPAAGKTGTTNGFNDAWFVGFTPHLVAGVWVGFDQPQTIVANGFAADLAVPIWAAFMKSATKGDPPDWFTRPDSIVGVNVCRLSGQLPNAGCGNVETQDTKTGRIEARSMVYTDYFVKGRQPEIICTQHPLAASGNAIATTQATPSAPLPQATMGAVVGGSPALAGTPVAVGTDSAPPPPQQPQKKKSFWRKLFGGGKGGI